MMTEQKEQTEQVAAQQVLNTTGVERTQDHTSKKKRKKSTINKANKRKKETETRDLFTENELAETNYIFRDGTVPNVWVRFKY
jgi:hypothetical protein